MNADVVVLYVFFTLGAGKAFAAGQRREAHRRQGPSLLSQYRGRTNRGRRQGRLSSRARRFRTGADGQVEITF